MSRPSKLSLLALIALIVSLAAASAASAAAGPAPIVSDSVDPGDQVPAALEGRLGEMPSDGAAGLNAAAKSGGDRKGLGLPSYKGLLGGDWKQIVAKADRSFATRLDASESMIESGAGRERAGSAADTFDRKFKIGDQVKGKGGKQTRKLKVAAELDGGCPRPGEIEGYGWTGTARATYEVTTTERVGRYVVVTAVILDANFGTRPDMLDSAQAEDFSTADYGRIEMTRSQVAVDRKTGKRHKVGETERFSSSIDPFYKPEGDFLRFIADQEDGAPAPERPLRAPIWNDVATWFLTIPYDALRSRVLEAEKLAQTPNRCVKLDLPGDVPTHLAPGQKVELRGIPKLVEGNVTPFYILKEASRLPANWINMQGQQAAPLGEMHQMWNGKPWYSFTAPAQAWPASKPVGLELQIVSAAGIGSRDVTFLPEDPTVHYEILDASISTDTDASKPSPVCGEVGGQKQVDTTFTPTGFSPDDMLTVDEFGDIEGQVEGAVDLTYHDHHLYGCKVGADAGPCDEMMDNRTKDSSVWVGFGDAADPSKVRLTWAFEDPEVGYVDAGDDECNSHVWGYFNPDVNHTTVSRSQLQGTGPITLTLAGSGHISQSGIESVSIDHTWEYEITIQRVDENGNPLS
jgi:hypothetical protein